MSSRPRRVALQFVLALFAICFVAVSARAQGSTNIITGTVEKVDSGAKTIAVKTADGTVETVKFTDRTTVNGLKDGAKGADLAGNEGSQEIVHTAGEDADKKVNAVQCCGDKTFNTT